MLTNILEQKHNLRLSDFNIISLHLGPGKLFVYWLKNFLPFLWFWSQMEKGMTLSSDSLTIPMFFHMWFFCWFSSPGILCYIWHAKLLKGKARVCHHLDMSNRNGTRGDELCNKYSNSPPPPTTNTSVMNSNSLRQKTCFWHPKDITWSKKSLS